MAGVIVGVVASSSFFPDDIALPIYSYSAERIFSNEFLLFDINFFNPRPAQTIEQEITLGYDDGLRASVEVYHGESISKDDEWLDGIDGMTKINSVEVNKTDFHDFIKGFCFDIARHGNSTYIKTMKEDESWYLAQSPAALSCFNDAISIANKALRAKGYYPISTGDDGIKPRGHYGTVDHYQSQNWSESDYGNNIAFSDSPAYYVGRIDVNTSEINDEKGQAVTILLILKWDPELLDQEIRRTQKITIESTAAQLQGVVSKWYFTLRNLAIIVLLLVLLYSGIRIVLGSTAGEKAKYKERIQDWLVALCLVLIMHYIMVFAVNIVEKIIQLVKEATDDNGNFVVIELSSEHLAKIREDEIIEQVAPKLNMKAEDMLIDKADAESGKALLWPTDLMGMFKVQSQFENEGSEAWVAYSLCFVILVMFTIFFTFTYIKRVIYIAFLTMIAPLVAMTYPIDKITDGKAQAFNMWLKEYIFNLMIQPMHLLLYTILVTSAYELASNNAIYALVAIGFMMPAEKLVRKFFGFEKAQTPGLLGGAAGAAIAMTGLQSLMKPKNIGGHENKDKDKAEFSNRSKIKTMEGVAGGPPPERTNREEEAQNSNNGGGGNARNLLSPLRRENANGNGNGNAEAEGVDPAAQAVHGREQRNSDSEGTNASVPRTRRAQANATQSASTRKPRRARKVNNIKKPSKARRILRATGSVARATGRQVAGRVLKSITPLKWMKRALLGATLGTAGLLVGTMSGDASKAFQYATAGIAGGSKLADSLSGVLDGEELQRESEMSYYGEDYKEHQIEKQKREFEKNRSNINYIRQTMGVSEREAKEILSTTGGQCFDEGITDVEDIATIHQLTTGEDPMSFKQAASARSYAKKRLPSNPDQMTQESVEQYIARWKKEFSDAGYEDPEKLARQSFDLAIRYNKAQSGLTKNP